MQNEEVKNKAIRLVFVDIDYYTSKQLKASYLDQNYFISNPYSLPDGMSLEDACKVVSFISETTEREDELQPASQASVSLTSAQLENYGFKKQPTKQEGYRHSRRICDGLPKSIRSCCKPVPNVVDLYTVAKMQNFKKTNLSDRYFEWFTPNVSNEEIVQIYDRINLPISIDEHEM